MNNINDFDNYMVKNKLIWKIDIDEFAKIASAKSLFIPKKVKTIFLEHQDAYLFDDIKFLKRIEVDENNSYFYSNGSNAIIERASQKLILGCKNTVIPNEVKFIEPCAFVNSNIEKIEIPGSVEIIGSEAFDNCENLKEVIIKEGVKEIGFSAFSGTNIEKIVIPSSVKKIGDFAFSYCKNLKEVIIKDGVKEIGDSAFAFTNIEKIEIPASVEVIGVSAFINRNIEKINVDKNNHYFYSNSSNAIIEKASQKLILGCKNTVIPNDVKFIGDFAFNNCNIEKIEIPSSVKMIAKGAFSCCENLKEVIINDGVKEIGDGAFTNTNIKKIKIPASVEIINDSAFINRNIEKINVDEDSPYFYSDDNNAIIEKVNQKLILGCKNTVIPSKVKIIGSMSFVSSDIERIEIPGSVKTIERNAFAACENLKEIIIGKGLKEIGYLAFFNSGNIEKINVDENNPYFYSDGSNAIIERASQKLILGCKNTVIPSKVKIIESKAFIRSNIEKIEIPGSVEIIGSEAFEDCENLKEVIIKDGVKEIGLSAFFGTNIEKIIIPSSVKKIDWSVFNNCKNLREVIIKEGVREIGNDAFANTNIEKIVIPSSLKKINGFAFSGCGNLKDVVIKEGVKKINKFAFYKCAIEELIIPSSVEIIENSAFEECKNLKRIKLLGKTKICNYAFKDCCSLKEVLQSQECICKIEKNAFSGCDLIENK